MTAMRMRFLFFAALVFVLGFSDFAVAQSAHPFATPEQRLSVPTSGWFAEFTGQMAAWQGQFYRQLTGAVRAWKQDGWAAWLLLWLSFGYGVFHALGPGHGKAVLTAYVLANKETIRNGALLAMGLGTGLTVAALACSSLWISQAAVQSESASQRRWQKALMLILQALASVAVLALGVLLLSAALSTGTTGN